MKRIESEISPISTVDEPVDSSGFQQEQESQEKELLREDIVSFDQVEVVFFRSLMGGCLAGDDDVGKCGAVGIGPGS